MFQNFDPTRMTINGPSLSRRSALAGLGGMLGGAALLGAAGCAARPAGSTPGAGNSLNLDFSKAEDNLMAWVKLASSLEDGVETCGYFAGTQYAVIGTQEVITPLFRIQGFGMSRVTKLPDGRYQNLHREVVYYLDLKEDRIIDSWKNPYTGEEVEVFHTHNDPVNSHYATSFKQRFGSEEGGFKTVEFPFILPWQIFGNRAVVSFEVNTRWPTPLPPASGRANISVSGTARASISRSTRAWLT